MLEVPSTPWTETPGPEDLGRDAPAACEWQPIKGQVRHTFTHFHLELNVVAGKADKLDLDPEIMWADPRNLDDLALPTVMKKVVELALATEE